MPLCGKPVLAHSIESFVSCGATVAVVLPSSHITLWSELCAKHGIIAPHQVVPGGEQRFHSVKNALKALATQMQSDYDVVAVHDGVRPLASTRLINNAFATAARCGSAIPAINVTDTIRQVAGDGSSRQLDRSTLRAVQTPQAFRAGMLIEAYNVPYSPLFTDDASVVECSSHSVTLIDGEATNIKITHPADLLTAQQIIEALPRHDA